MAKEEKGTRAALDRIGGKLIYRLVSLAFLVMAAVSASGAWWALSDGGNSIWPGLIMAAAALGCLWAVRWCWSPRRRLSEIDE